jgi:uncharacterized membrane protein
MNFLILLIICLIVVGFALIALGINFLLRKRQPLKDGSYKNESANDGKGIRCDCGQGSCCAIE